jgi:hypothetical protein
MEYYEIFAILFLIFLYWFFIIRDQYITISIPVEKMSNISIFDGNKI